MSKELVISANRHETKVALLEDDQLVEVFFQRANEYSLAGSIHKGRVTRVLPGMQSAFVDLGLERDTFLYVSDFFEENEEFDRVPVGRESRESRPQERGRPPIETAPREAPMHAGETAAVGAPSEASQAAARSEEGDRERRGGRRSRRRRGRGRGFPESKYASDVGRDVSRPTRPTEATGPVEPTAETAREAAAREAAELSVLPGESLAKYRHSEIAPLDEIEEEEIRTLQEAVDEAVAEEAAAAEADASDELETEAELEAEAGLSAVEESLAPEMLAEPVAVPEPDAPISASSQLDDEPEVELAEVIAIDEVPAGPVEATSLLDAEEPGETALDASSETTPAETAAAGAETSPATAGPQTAHVRDQGGRFPHRMPRRMRRKMRGGGFGESRFEGERRIEPGVASSEPAITRPEASRSVSRPERPSAPSISELLKEGQEIIVQIAKEPLGQKGARITSHIALPGRYVVYMPTVEHTGVSRKISTDEERQRLKRILQTHSTGVPGGYIVRTAGEGKSEEDLAADMNFLFNLWLDIRQKAEKSPAPVLLHHDLDIVQRTLRDQLTEEFKAIWVDNEEMYESVVRFVQRFQPPLVSRIKLYTRSEPIFDAFNITAELEKALRPKVWLKSGGYIVINQTEALVAIDVNTGKYVGRSNRLEDTIVKTNTEAVKEIVRQVRLRDLGGIIVVDFIDMDERKNRQKVMQALEDAMRADRAPYKILQFNDFGLVAITRKRVKQSLERSLCMPCPYCEGAGYVKSVPTTVSEILQEAHKLAPAIDFKDVILRVHPDVARFLKSNQNKYLEEIEEILHRSVLVKGDPLLHHEKFDLA